MRLTLACLLLGGVIWGSQTFGSHHSHFCCDQKSSAIKDLDIDWTNRESLASLQKELITKKDELSLEFEKKLALGKEVCSETQDDLAKLDELLNQVQSTLVALNDLTSK